MAQAMHERDALASFRDSQERLLLALDAAGLGLLVWHIPEDVVVWETDRTYEIFGRSREQGPINAAEFHANNLFPEDEPLFQAAIDAAMADRTRFFYQVKVRRGEGVAWLEFMGQFQYGADGTPLRMIGTVMDITARMGSEEALRISEERLRLAQEASWLAAWDWNLVTDEVSWSGNVEAVYGRPAEQVTPISRTASYVDKRDLEGTMQALQQAIETGGAYNHEFRVVWPNGSTQWIAGRGKTVRWSADGAATRMVGTNWNITDRKRGEEALHEEGRRLADLFEQAPAFLAVLNGPTFIFERVNPPYQQLIGYRDVIGRPVAEAMPEVVNQGYLELLGRVYHSGEAFVANAARILLDRNPGQPLEERYMDFVYQPRRESNGEITGIIALGIDVTERQRAEAALIQSEKLAAVGRLASSIAHEINNPLEAVTNLLYLANTVNADDEVKSYLTDAEQELRRVAAITNQTLRFHRQSSSPTLAYCGELLASVRSVYQGRLHNTGIRSELRERATLPILCFEGEVRQVLANLVGNAIDAMMPLGGGRLVMRSREATDWNSGDRGILLTIADTGSGMNAATVQKLFEPFFSTKGDNGTGLGLWISKQIVERHRGTLRVRSSQAEMHHGTVFTLFLPFSAEQRSSGPVGATA